MLHGGGASPISDIIPLLLAIGAKATLAVQWGDGDDREDLGSDSEDPWGTTIEQSQDLASLLEKRNTPPPKGQLQQEGE